MVILLLPENYDINSLKIILYGYVLKIFTFT